MLPTPEIRVWSSSSRLTPEVRFRSRATKWSSSNAGSIGSRAMCAISWGSTAPPAEIASPPNIRWSTNLSSVRSSRVRRTLRCRSGGAAAGWTSIWPLIPRWARSASSLSSGSQRYFPRRCALITCRPVSWAAKSAGPPACRRTGRGWKTSTAVIVCPTTRRSRPSRTTSTSGSSGTSADWTGQRGVGLDRIGVERIRVLFRDGAVGGLRGLLLGLLLGAAGAVPVELVADADPRGEGLLVVGTVVLDDVLRHAEGVLGVPEY